jgi:hypothetical protein
LPDTEDALAELAMRIDVATQGRGRNAELAAEPV